MTYVRATAPFHFQGSMTEEQKGAFRAWVTERVAFAPEASTFHRIRAQQLRKSAGLLEAFYKKHGLEPSFTKAPWVPDTKGHIPSAQRDDRLPSVVVGAVKDRLVAPLSYVTNAVFRMNYLRVQIESHEDLAQEAAEAKELVTTKLAALEDLFNDANYAAVLVKTKDVFPEPGDPSGVAPMPRYRVHPLDPPTHWERWNAGQPLL